MASAAGDAGALVLSGARSTTFRPMIAAGCVYLSQSWIIGSLSPSGIGAAAIRELLDGSTSWRKRSGDLLRTPVIEEFSLVWKRTISADAALVADMSFVHQREVIEVDGGRPGLVVVGRAEEQEVNLSFSNIVVVGQRWRAY
jgi:hypothetical protein